MSLVLDSRSLISSLHKDLPKEPAIQFLMLKFWQSFRKAVVRGCYRRLKRRLQNFILPYLVTRYISGFLLEKKINGDFLLAMPFQVILPEGLTCVAYTHDLLDLNKQEPVYNRKIHKALEQYRMVHTSL